MDWLLFSGTIYLYAPFVFIFLFSIKFYFIRNDYKTISRYPSHSLNITVSKFVFSGIRKVILPHRFNDKTFGIELTKPNTRTFLRKYCNDPLLININSRKVGKIGNIEIKISFIFPNRYIIFSSKQFTKKQQLARFITGIFSWWALSSFTQGK